MSRINQPLFNFEDVFERIRRKTNIKNYVQLAEIVGVTQQAVSKNKKKNNFPMEWAYLIAEKFNLELIWLLKGEKSEDRSENTQKERSNDLLNEIDKWLEVEAKKKPEIRDWFKFEFSRKFPEFEEWKEKKGSRFTEDSFSQEQKIA